MKKSLLNRLPADSEESPEDDLMQGFRQSGDTTNESLKRAAPPLAAAYVRDIVQADLTGDNIVVSIVMFGSAATGGYSEGTSDIDLLLIVRDDTTEKERGRLRDVVTELEMRRGAAKQRSGTPGLLENFFDRLTANTHSFFICTRADLLSGEPGRILGVPAFQAKFVDRITIASILVSGITMWGENLLAQVPLPPLRRIDVGKAFFGLFNQLLLSAVCYPLLPTPTKYAIDILKRSVHSCYFCYCLRPSPLAEEIDFFQRQYDASAVLTQMIKLRDEYYPSFGFVLKCFFALVQLHWRTARDNDFPRQVRAF